MSPRRLFRRAAHVSERAPRAPGKRRLGRVGFAVGLPRCLPRLPEARDAGVCRGFAVVSASSNWA
eukprot:931102-Pyramimonas_sp.AAC.1